MEISQSEKEYIEQIIKEFNEGKKIKDIAKMRQTTENNIKRQLFELGGEEGREILLQDLEIASGIPIKQMVLEYEQNKKTIKQISDEYGIGVTKLGETIRRYELITGKKIIVKPSSNIDVEEILQKYRNGITAKEIANEIDILPSAVYRTIYQHAKENGNDIQVEHRSNWNARRSNNHSEQVDSDIENLENEKENRKENEKSRIKVLSLNAACKIIEKYNYTFEELFREAKERGYIITREMYEKALEMMNKLEQEKIEGEEVEW